MKKFLENLKLPSLFWIFLSALILRLAIAVPFYSGDVGNHVVWGQSLVEDGPVGFYGRSFPNVVFPTYGPVGMLPFGISYLAFIFSVNFTWFLNTSIPPFPSNLVYFFSFENYNLIAAFTKLSAIFGDLLVGVFIYLFVINILKFKNPKLYPVFYLFNPAVFYLSAIWGQFESLVLAFVLGSLFFLFIKKPIWSSIFFAAALLTKQTAVFFAPIFLVIFFKKFGISRLFQSIGIMIVFFYVLYLPFGFTNPVETFTFYWKTFSYVTDKIYENAFNFWYLIFAPAKPFDFATFATIPHRILGIVATAVFSLPALFLLAKKTTPKVALFTAFYLLLTTFLLLTRIHERYLAFALPFPLLLAASSVNFLWFYLFLSFFHLLNLYNGFFQPNIGFFNLLVENLVIIKILILLLLGVFIYLIIKVWKQLKYGKA